MKTDFVFVSTWDYCASLVHFTVSVTERVQKGWLEIVYYVTLKFPPRVKPL